MSKPNALPSKTDLNKVLNCNPQTGILTWKISTGRVKIGHVAGSERNNPSRGTRYRRITVLGVETFVHRVIWKMVHDEDPDMIDHINRNGLDNRICNLRSVNSQGNQWNQGISKRNSSKVQGVSFHDANKLWLAMIEFKLEGKRHCKNLGYYQCKAMAGLVYSINKHRRDSMLRHQENLSKVQFYIPECRVQRQSYNLVRKVAVQ